MSLLSSIFLLLKCVLQAWPGITGNGTVIVTGKLADGSVSGSLDVTISGQQNAQLEWNIKEKYGTIDHLTIQAAVNEAIVERTKHPNFWISAIRQNHLVIATKSMILQSLKTSQRVIMPKLQRLTKM